VEGQVSVCLQLSSPKGQIEHAAIQLLSLDFHSTQTPFVVDPVWALSVTGATWAVVQVTVVAHVLPISASASVVVSLVAAAKQF
jgi:hypothetical protein